MNNLKMKLPILLLMPMVMGGLMVNTSNSITTKSADKLATYDTSVYGNYYDSLISWTNGEDLKSQLYTILHNAYTANTYEGNWTTTQNADQSLTNLSKVSAVYTDNEFYKSLTNTGYQREHAFAASLMTGKLTSVAVKTLGMATDFHNLWAADGSANGSRGNKNLGEVDDTEKTGEIGGCRYSADTFEPLEKDKGRLARSLFYMATMYGDSTNGLFLRNNVCTANTTTSTTEKCHGHLDDLLVWNNNDVDLSEYQHMKYVYSQQGNRNPYIDYPGLVDYVYGDKVNQSGTLATIEPACSKLDLVSTDNYGLAVQMKNDTYRFEVGNSFAFSNLSAYMIKKNLSKSAINISDCTVNGITDGYVFTKADLGTKEYSVTYNNETVKFDLEIINNPVAKCNFSFIGVSGSNPFTGAVANVQKQITLSEIPFLFKMGDDSHTTATLGNFYTNKGFQIGTGTKTANIVTLESVNDFTFDGKSGISSLSFAGNTASGETYTVKFFVDGNQVGTTKTISYNESDYSYAFVDLDKPVQGKVKIEISGITKALYFGKVGINTTTMTNANDNTSNLGLIIGLSIGGVVLIMIVLFVIIFVLWKNNKIVVRKGLEHLFIKIYRKKE